MCVLFLFQFAVGGEEYADLRELANNAVNIEDYKSEVKMIGMIQPLMYQRGLSLEIRIEILNSSKKVLQFKFDLLYITLFSVFSTKIGIIRKLV